MLDTGRVVLGGTTLRSPRPANCGLIGVLPAIDQRTETPDLGYEPTARRYRMLPADRDRSPAQDSVRDAA